MVTKNYTAPLRTMLMTILKTEFNSDVSFLSSRLDNDNDDNDNDNDKTNIRGSRQRLDPKNKYSQSVVKRVNEIINASHRLSAYLLVIN